MLRFKKILVPYDGSEHAKKAVELAVEQCQNTDGAKLYLLTVGQSQFGKHSVDSAYDAERAGGAKEHLTKMAEDEAEAMIPKDIQSDTLYDTGDPREIVVHTAEELGVDLIVMGSRGLGGFSTMLMGSCSNYVVGHAHCPVLIAR